MFLNTFGVEVYFKKIVHVVQEIYFGYSTGITSVMIKVVVFIQ